MNRPILWKPHEGAQSEFLSRNEDFVLFASGKGSGKSDSLLFESLRQIHNKNYHGLIIRRTIPRLRELVDRAHKYFPRLGAKWSGQTNRYEFPTGAMITFGHCQHEQDKQNYQGHQYQGIFFDQLEEFTESQFNFINAQNRTDDPTLKCYIRATANPGGIGHWWIKRRFIDGKKSGQTIEDRYELPDGRTATRTSCYISATIYDNPTLLAASPTYLSNLLSLPEIERRAYLEGDWNAFASQCVFDAHGMQMQELQIREPGWIGYLRESRELYQIVPDENGELKIWVEPKDEVEYQIGADVAEGDEDGNYSVAHVIDKRNWEQVAVWHGHIGAFEFAKILDRLGRYYNLAELSVEVPGPGIATVEKLGELDYPDLYEYETGKKGFRTDSASRSNLIATLLDAVRDGSVKIHDRDTLDEMYNFIRHERTMKIKAREGTFDDRVMSLGIALHCIRINPFYEPRHPSKQRRSPISVTNVSPIRRR